MANQKYLKIEEHSIIETMLNERSSFTEIGKVLGKDRTTVSKEVRSHLIFRKTGYKGNNITPVPTAFPAISTTSAPYAGLTGGLSCAADVSPATSSVRILLRSSARNSSRNHMSVMAAARDISAALLKNVSISLQTLTENTLKRSQKHDPVSH